MAEVNPAEVTAILKQELAGFRSEAELEEVAHNPNAVFFYCFVQARAHVV